MERIPGGKYKQPAMNNSVRSKVSRQDVDGPVITLEGSQQQAQQATVSEVLRDVQFRVLLLNVPPLPIGSNVGPPSSIGGTHLCRSGSLDSTDRNKVNSAAAGLPPDGSVARVGGFGAFSSSSAEPPPFSGDAGGNMQYGSGLGAGAGATEAPVTAAAGLEAADASEDTFGVFEALQNLPPEEQQQVLLEVNMLQKMRLLRAVPGWEEGKGKSHGHSSLKCSAYAVFQPSVDALASCSDEDAVKLLATSKPVQSSLGPLFHSSFAARQAECQQPGGEQQLLVAKCTHRFLMDPGVENPQRQLQFTTDSAAMRRSVRNPRLWPAADPGQRKLAVDLLVAAAVRVALGAHPGVPPGLLLFSTKAQARKATVATSTFYDKMQKMCANQVLQADGIDE